MSIVISREKAKGLTTQDVYDIISMAVEAADDNGFINNFVLERALYELAATMYENDPVRKKEMSALVAQNVNTAWDAFVEDGTIERLLDEHGEDIEYISECASTWVDEYKEYAHSFRGLLDAFQDVSGSIVDVAAKRLQQTVSDTRADEVFAIADKWGMNNKPEAAQELVKAVLDDKSEKDATKARKSLKTVDGGAKRKTTKKQTPASE